jgi:antirestriction protein
MSYSEYKEAMSTFNASDIRYYADLIDGSFMDAIQLMEHDSFDEYPDALVAYVSDVGLEWGLSSFDDAYCGEWNTEEEYAEHLVDSGCFGDVPQSLQYYIDYEAVARDVFIGDCMFIRDAHSQGHVFYRM